MRIVDFKTIQRLIDKYTEAGGEVIEVEPGVLGYGLTVIGGVPKYKTLVIRERYKSEWASEHSLMAYNRCPKKYEKYFTL